VTTPANALISKITDRMPATLQSDDWATWLGEEQGSLADVKAVFQTFEDGGNWTMEEQPRTRNANAKKYEGQPGLF
jgi:putative SOS response-associated peptidase YedK